MTKLCILLHVHDNRPQSEIYSHCRWDSVVRKMPISHSYQHFFFFLVFGFALARSATVFCLKRFSIAFEMVGVFKGANE